MKKKKKVKEKTKQKTKAVEKVRSEWEDLEDGKDERMEEIMERIQRMERNLWATVHAGFEKTHAKMKNIVDLIDPEWLDCSVEDVSMGTEMEVSDIEEMDGEEKKGIREEKEWQRNEEVWGAWLKEYQGSKGWKEVEEEKSETENGGDKKSGLELEKKGEEEKEVDIMMRDVGEGEEEETQRVQRVVLVFKSPVQSSILTFFCRTETVTS